MAENIVRAELWAIAAPSVPLPSDSEVQTAANDGNWLKMAVEKWWSCLKRQYSEPHRVYHNLEHVADLISKAKKLTGVVSPKLLMFSILFHDIVYETDTGDSMSDSDDDEQCPLDTNERMSATTWLECAEDFRMSKADADIVWEFIIATESHSIEKADVPENLKHDLMLFLDLDMSILGSSETAYDKYAEQIKEENSAKALSYGIERSIFLRKLLEKPSLFLTSEFKSLDAQARSNIQRELSSLTL